MLRWFGGSVFVWLRGEQAMEITEVRVKLVEDADDRLQAFCSITFDHSFVVRDLKIIEGTNGPFVAMPSRKMTAHCPRCHCKNHTRASYCNQCGNKLKQQAFHESQDGRSKLYADIAHPINSECRELIQDSVLEEYRIEVARSKEADYSSRHDEGGSAQNVESGGPHLDQAQREEGADKRAANSAAHNFGAGIFDN